MCCSRSQPHELLDPLTILVQWLAYVAILWPLLSIAENWDHVTVLCKKKFGICDLTNQSTSCLVCELTDRDGGGRMFRMWSPYLNIRDPETHKL